MSSTCAAPTAARSADMRDTWNRAPRSSSACSRRSASSRTGPWLVSSATQSSSRRPGDPGPARGRPVVADLGHGRAVPPRRWAPGYERRAPVDSRDRPGPAGRAGRRRGWRRAQGQGQREAGVHEPAQPPGLDVGVGRRTAGGDRFGRGWATWCESCPFASGGSPSYRPSPVRPAGRSGRTRSSASRASREHAMSLLSHPGTARRRSSWARPRPPRRPGGRRAAGRRRTGLPRPAARGGDALGWSCWCSACWAPWVTCRFLATHGERHLGMSSNGLLSALSLRRRRRPPRRGAARSANRPRR